MAVTQMQAIVRALAQGSGGRVIAAPSKVPGGYLPTAPVSSAPSSGGWLRSIAERVRAQAAPPAAVPIAPPAPISDAFGPPTSEGGMPVLTQALTDQMADDAAGDREQQAGAQPEQAGFGAGIGPLLIIGLVLAFLSGGKKGRRR